MKKKCTGCSKIKDESEFGLRNKNGWFRQPCKLCKCKIQKERRKLPDFLEKERVYNRDYRSKNLLRLKQRYLDWKTSIRVEVLGTYSKSKIPKCACCKENTLEFLCIDHIEGGGKKHLQKINRRGIGLYTWLRTNKYPKGFQVLCHNCNLAKGFYGKCPHKK